MFSFVVFEWLDEEIRNGKCELNLTKNKRNKHTFTYSLGIDYDYSS